MRSSWCALVGEVAGMLRDFSTADTWLKRAREIAPQSAWIEVCHATLMEFEDRYDEAVAAARRALELRPWYRPAVQSLAHLLSLRNRDDEALELLSTANERLESDAIAGQLYALQIELKHYAAAGQTLDRFEQLSPLMEKSLKKWLAAQRAEVAYHLGDIETAIASGKASDSEFWKLSAERLADPARAAAKQVTLPVPFVRQHHVTCGPATLAAISSFWSMPADHLQVVDEICYNGTSHHSERKWAADHGWAAREFSVTEESAQALLDRGIPFTFTTIEPANAHLQAIIGYDGRRGTLIVRDPFLRNSGDAFADKFLDHYRASGPRGMAMVPVEQAAKLIEVELPDAALWDQLHALDGALLKHRREPAQAAFDAMQTAAPEHRLTLEARRRLAIYDGSHGEQLAAAEALLAQFPNEQWLQLERLSLLRHQARRDERLTTYEELCKKKDASPIFWQQYAQELRIDARRHAEALWLLKRAIRRWPTHAANYYILANIYWDHRRFEDALELYRFAACLGDKEEEFVQSYFTASGWFKQTEAALAFLRDRVERIGKKSSLPARTLAWAFMQVDRTGEALAAIESAIKLMPEDGQLMLYAADLYLAASLENMPRARQLVEQAKDNAPRGEWLRTAARVARSDGQPAESLGLWREVLNRQPLAIDAHGMVARLLAETEGRAAAVAHLRQAVERFEHHYPLHEMWIEWLRDEPEAVRETAIRKLIELHPDNGWAQRELAFLLAGQKKYEEAWAAARIAGGLEPSNPSYQHLLALLNRNEGKLDAARAALKAAVELSVDNDYAIAELLDLCESQAQRREALAFVKEQLVKQVTFGDGLLAYRNHAAAVLDPAELLAMLREALAVRPDLWHAWSAATQQTLQLNELDEARRLSEQATERFPLIGKLWLDRARVCRARKDADGELESLQTAYRMQPAWGLAARSLAEALERRGKYGESRDLLVHAVARNPLDCANHGMLAETLWHLGERQAALDRVQEAVKVDPSEDRCWDCLRTWSDELGCPDRAIETARELTATRAGEARSWLFLARILDAPEQSEERMAALAKAIELNPRCIDAYDMQAITLAGLGRWDEAEAVCRPAVWNHQPPSELRARHAWLAAERGDVREAIARMQAVVADEPHFFGAWTRLADWCVAAQDKETYLQAAEAMVRINPQYEVGYGYLAEARLMMGDRAGSKQAYADAFALSPQYEFAGNGLFDMQLEDGELAAAQQTLETMRSHGDGAFVLAREVQLSMKKGELPRALQTLEKLCITKPLTPWPLEGAVQAFVDAGSAGDAERVLERMVESPDSIPDVGRQWIWLQVRRNDWGCGRRLRPLLAKNRGVAEEGAVCLVRMLADAGNASELGIFIGANGDWLKASDATWGAVGSALAGIRDYQPALRWMSDWRERPNAEPWMLVNTIEALRAVGRIDEAVEVSQAALERRAPGGKQFHRLWLAIDAAAVGDAETAGQHLQQVDVAALPPDWALLGWLAQGYVEIATAEPAERPRVFAGVRKRIEAARRGYKAFDHEPGHRRAYRQVSRQIAALAGTFSAKLWQAWTWVRSHVRVM